MATIRTRTAGLLVVAVIATVMAGIVYVALFNDQKTVSTPLAWFRSGTFEIGVGTVPRTPRVGDNQIIVELRKADGTSLHNPDVEAFAEMPAMGAMPAMRAPADLKEVAPGRYEGKVDLRMRGAWPLTVRIQDVESGAAELSLDMATDRPGLQIAVGGVPLAARDGDNAALAPASQADSSRVITIDSRRRQLIGVKTATATRRNLVREIRAVGRVTYDERRLSNVTLKFDAWVGELKADYLGAPVEQGQVLFTVYSPELLAAQQEYLETLKRLARRGPEDTLIKAARQRLKLWDMSASEVAALEKRGQPREYVPIYAPRSGTVVAKHVDSGSAVKMGETLLRIADLSQVWVEAEVYEADLELVRDGMAATVTLPYLPNRSYEARVDYIYPYLEGDSRTGRVRLTLDNPSGALKPDMYAEVTLKANLGHQLAVPEEAVMIAGDSRVVFVDLGEGRLKPVKIKTGRRAQGFIEVLDGLISGDTVVTSGNFLIASETKLKAGIDQW